MIMNKHINVIVDLAEAFEKPKTVSEHMEYSNWYYKQINKNDWHIPFQDKDIQFVKLFERLDCNQRERDLIYISQFFHSAYTTLHVTILTLGETPTPGSLEELKRTYETLIRLDNQTNILFNDKIDTYEFLSILEKMKD